MVQEQQHLPTRREETAAAVLPMEPASENIRSLWPEREMKVSLDEGDVQPSLVKEM